MDARHDRDPRRHPRRRRRERWLWAAPLLSTARRHAARSSLEPRWAVDLRAGLLLLLLAAGSLFAVRSVRGDVGRAARSVAIAFGVMGLAFVIDRAVAWCRARRLSRLATEDGRAGVIVRPLQRGEELLPSLCSEDAKGVVAVALERAGGGPGREGARAHGGPSHDGAASGPKPRAPAGPSHDGAASGPKPRAPAGPSHDGAASGPKPRAPAGPSHDGAASGPKPRAPAGPFREASEARAVFRWDPADRGVLFGVGFFGAQLAIAIAWMGLGVFHALTPLDPSHPPFAVATRYRHLPIIRVEDPALELGGHSFWRAPTQPVAYDEEEDAIVDEPDEVLRRYPPTDSLEIVARRSSLLRHSCAVVTSGEVTLEGGEKVQAAPPRRAGDAIEYECVSLTYPPGPPPSAHRFADRIAPQRVTR